jgi:hypothetical protein
LIVSSDLEIACAEMGSGLGILRERGLLGNLLRGLEMEIERLWRIKRCCGVSDGGCAAPASD